MLVAHLRLAPLVWDVWSSSVNHNHLLHVLKCWVRGHRIMIGELWLLCVACDRCVWEGVGGGRVCVLGGGGRREGRTSY